MDNRYVDLSSLQGAWREGLLTLMYHAIETPPLRHDWRALYVEPQKLRRQLRELIGTGARIITLDEWLHDPATDRRVIITFDDGFQNTLINALPVLRELAVPSINYIVVKGIGGTNFWDQHLNVQVRPLMTRAEIDEWLAAGQQIGSHTLSHPHLTSLSEAQARAEIFDSKKALEDMFNRRIDHFCYPYGDMNDRIRELVGEAGYLTAPSVVPGLNPNPADALMLPRFFATHRRPRAVALARTAQNLLRGRF